MVNSIIVSRQNLYSAESVQTDPRDAAKYSFTGIKELKSLISFYNFIVMPHCCVIGSDFRIHPPRFILMVLGFEHGIMFCHVVM